MDTDDENPESLGREPEAPEVPEASAVSDSIDDTAMIDPSGEEVAGEDGYVDDERDHVPAASQIPVAQQSQPPAPPKKKRRGWCFCCLAFVLLPIVALIALIIWVSTGDAPPPSDCMPPDAPLRVVVRDPAEVVGRILRDPEWQQALQDSAAKSGGKANVPSGGDIDNALIVFRQALGGESALALEEGGEVIFSTRPGMWARLVEWMLRGKLKKDKNFAYGMIGTTLVASKDRNRLEAVMNRKEKILQLKGSTSPPADVGAEVRFKDFKPATFEAPEDGIRMAALMMELSSAEKFSGHVRLDRDLAKISGYLHFPAGKHGAAPPLGSVRSRAAALVPADALGFWVWSAPSGQKRWDSGGRLEELMAVTGKSLMFLEGSDAEKLKAQLGYDLKKLLSRDLAGERAVSVVAQQRAGGKPLMAAASLMLEVRNPKENWPKLKMLIGSMYLKSPDGVKPPEMDGTPVSPYFVERKYRGQDYLELAYITKDVYGSGFRPAFGMAGGFLVATTSRMELERMMDRAATGGGKSMAADPELAAAGKGAALPASVLLLRPQGKGKQIADLLVAVDRSSGKDKDGGADKSAEANMLGRMISTLESLRARWQPQKNGSLKVEIDGKVVLPAK